MNAHAFASHRTSAHAVLYHLLSLAPLAVSSVSLLSALANATIALIALLLCAMLTLPVHRIANPVTRLALHIVILLCALACVALLVSAFAPELYRSIGAYLPLLIMGFIVNGVTGTSAGHAPVRNALDAGLIGAVLALALGTARELLGRGGLFLDAPAWFGARAQHWPLHLSEDHYLWLFALLPAGGFIALGCLLALRPTHRERAANPSTSSDPSS